MSRGRTTTAAVVVLSVAAISAGTWGLSKWRPFERETATIEWPQNVQPLIDYIESTTELRFRGSIDFEFIANIDDYNARARRPVVERSADDRADIAIEEAAGRALGLWDGDASIVESADTITGSTPRSVRWLPDPNVVLLHARDETSRLSPSLRADLVVYLTQALLDQNFNLIERRNATETPQEYDALASLHIGYALWARDLYIGDLGSDDRNQYADETFEQSQQYADEVSEVPATYRAIQIAFQVLGPPFVTALAEEDLKLIHDALGNRAPMALDQISLPAAKYLRNDAPEPVTDPPGPLAATIHFSDQLGPFRMYLMFATALPANTALTAADGWGNDRVTVYELDGRVCADVHIVADSPADADRMEQALNHWALARPAAADALIGRDIVNLYASVCDPGMAASQALPSDAAIEQFFGRADLLRQQAETTGKPALAECIATEFFAAHTTEQLSDDSLFDELDASFAAIEDTCRNSL